MISDIRTSLIEVLSGTPWMDKSTRQKALQKVSQVLFYVFVNIVSRVFIGLLLIQFLKKKKMSRWYR